MIFIIAAVLWLTGCPEPSPEPEPPPPEPVVHDVTGVWTGRFCADAGFFFNAEMHLQQRDRFVHGTMELTGEPETTIGQVTGYLDRDEGVYYLNAAFIVGVEPLAINLAGRVRDGSFEGAFEIVGGGRGQFTLTYQGEL